MEKRSIARSEALLDAAVEFTFPASDPISVDHAFHAAREEEKDLPRATPPGSAPTQPLRRSPTLRSPGR
jgi:hypothetical protein